MVTQPLTAKNYSFPGFQLNTSSESSDLIKSCAKTDCTRPEWDKKLKTEKNMLYIPVLVKSNILSYFFFRQYQL